MIARTLKLAAIFLLISVGSQCKKDSVTELEEATPKVGDYYVSLSGDDSNPGTDSLPWRTIQKAVNTVAPGKIVVVKPGNYEEYVTISESGLSDDARINIFSETPHTAKCLGFKIQGDYVTIDGFDIEANTHNWTGIYVSGNSYVNILNCYVHECPMGGIRLLNGASYAKITDNKLEHNGLWGISIIGNNALLEGNEISRTVQHHPKGHEPGFTGADADGLRIFGDGHIIRGNKILDIGDPDDSGNIDPHVDGIQTWDGGSTGDPIMTNALIEGNYFSINHASGKGILMEATKGNACHHITVRNNIFEFNDMGIGAYEGVFNDIYIYNNVFKANLNQKSWGTSVYLSKVTNYAVLNNISVDCHPEHRKILEGSGIVDFNLAWNSDGSAPTLTPSKQTNELSGVDPKFVTYTGKHGENDYHLQEGSPAINKGTTLDDVSFDFDGVARPQGSGFDIGAFEYK